ncbi:SMI1/KNR4 family protein [Nannocystis sp. RBIL2]|uniref:SMI1/KNR4 family protein n=1 Tax=Nannocystis sp. RBIL2 TaxID=2996788 RepID=UPI00226F9F4C|nr:SMI1/KNR4 family protein [Nannocystis sp. RBIL2]MCY1065488.1 SMI1/KNR4 family protein [Nannocystis sp. RBIL2]
MPKPTNWKKLLKKLSDDLLDEAQDEADFCLEQEVYERVIADHWLGRPGASEEALRAAEERLGLALPADYRAFLAASNGWYCCLMFPNGLACLLPVEEVQRSHASEANVDWVMQHHASELQGVDLGRETLLIGEGDGNEYIFLHPGKGPWGVCNWDHEIGITLFPSFEALMRSR